MNQFQYLFTPITIGKVTVANRILSTGHGTNFSVEGIPGERLAYYHRERAKGGMGLIVMECAMIHPTGIAFNLPIASDEKAIPGFRKVAQAVHEYDTKIFCQIGHPGRQLSSYYTQQPLLAPSGLPCSTNRDVPKAMEHEDMEELIVSWARAARNIREAGLDGVELHSGYGGYLLCQFLSPYSNQRKDEYGGSLENRLRFVLQVIDAVREGVGDDFTLGMQLNGDELTPSGLTNEDFQEIAKRLEQTGKLDYLTIKAGSGYCYNMIIPDSQLPLGCWVPFAAGIKEAVENILIFAVGRINDPLLAEKILADGHADMIGMTRANLCDPEMPRKARQGRLDEIRTCVACNQACQRRLFMGLAISCAQNPAVGREKEWGTDTLRPAARRKRVVIVGGGPAGLKAAEIAVTRGHEVSLWEREKELGGQVLLAAKIPLREEFGGIIRYLVKQIERLKIMVSLQTEATANKIIEQGADAVIIATGSKPQRQGFLNIRPDIPWIPGIDQSHVFPVMEWLQYDRRVGSKVLIVDDGEAHWRSMATADFLADQGKKVIVSTPLPSAGIDLPFMSLIPLYPRLFQKAVTFLPFTGLRAVSDHNVTIYNVTTNQEETLEEIDTVLLAFYQQADEKLYFELKGKTQELYRIGDCVAPRKVEDAIREGWEVGRKL